MFRPFWRRISSSGIDAASEINPEEGFGASEGKAS
jgi:hypothetical protein